MCGRLGVEWKGLPCAEPFPCARLCAGCWRDHGEGDSNGSKGHVSRKTGSSAVGPNPAHAGWAWSPPVVGGFLVCVAPQDDYGMGWEGVREVGEHSGQGLLEQRLRGKKLPGALGDWLSVSRTKRGERTHLGGDRDGCEAWGLGSFTCIPKVGERIWQGRDRIRM